MPYLGENGHKIYSIAQFVVFANQERMPKTYGVVQKIPRENSSLSSYLNFFRLSREQQQMIKERPQKKNNLILTKLCEELQTLSLYVPQIWGSFQSTFQKHYSLVILLKFKGIEHLPWAQKRGGKKRQERDNSHVLRMGQGICLTLPGYFIQHSSGYSLQSQKGIKIKPSYLPGIIRSENQ